MKFKIRLWKKRIRENSGENLVPFFLYLPIFKYFIIYI
nr:MAG TPA: hypothetical protein [Caudoviricetes sp.]